jgi:membrane protease YdiL (CAAX protease family)
MAAFRFPTPPEGAEALPLRAVIPGLLFILCIDVAGVAGVGGPLIGLWSIVSAVVPWITILVMRRRPSSLGYVRGRWLAEFGWGMLAGAIWRGLSMALSVAWLDGSILGLVGGFVWVPLVEETFFRGYLGRALSVRLGRWRGIILQAVLFAMLPGHWAQGWPALAGIFAFGVLAGWLVETRRTLWIGWGAHAFANVLPEILLSLT